MSPNYERGWESPWVASGAESGEHGYYDFAIESRYPLLRSIMTDFEANWTSSPLLTLQQRKFWWAGWVAVSLYFIALYFGTKFMKDRKPFGLKGPLAAWNLFLAVFSIIGTIRTVPQVLVGMYVNGGMYYVCRAAVAAYGYGACGLWTNIFIWSKYIELVDTAFLVLRKKPVNFLHWFHHATVLLYCWHAGEYETPTGVYFASMNYLVHAVMYTYYFLAAITKPPNWGMSVTVLQILQMFAGMFITGLHYHSKRTVKNCDGSERNLMAAFVMYTCYMLLFVQYFAQRYCAQRKVSAVTANGTSSKKNV